MKYEEKELVINLKGEEKSYILIKEKIKNIYIKIENKKIIVKAPKRITIKEIENILIKKEDWILEKLNENLNKVEKKPKYEAEEFKNIVLKDVNEYSEKIGVSYNKIRIKELKYAWGSCTSKKNITINSELIKYEEEIIKYVVIHELCHLKYMNHSKLFWNEVEKHMPNYKGVRKMLKSK